MSITIPSRAGQSAGVEGDGADIRVQSPDPAIVYLAAARNTFGTLTYRRAVCQLAASWPRSALMDAEACRFTSLADWQLRWPFIRDGVDCIVVLCEDDGTISHDTWLELRDATEHGTPCWFVQPDGTFVAATSVPLRLYPTGARTASRWARAQVGVAP
jgi:hypothetical protein